MNGSPHLQAVLTLGLDVPACSAKRPLALGPGPDNSLLNGICSQHEPVCVCDKGHCYSGEQGTKWKHVGDGCVSQHACRRGCVCCVFLLISLLCHLRGLHFQTPSGPLRGAARHSWLAADQPHDWAYPPHAMQPVPTDTRETGSETGSLHAVDSQLTDVVERRRLETGCGYGSTHGGWLSDNMHRIF